MKFKCHWCHKDLEEIEVRDERQILECPEAHCEIIYDTISQEIVKYNLWVDYKDKRFFIQGWKSSNATMLDLRVNGKSAWRAIEEMLFVDCYFPLNTNEDGILEGIALFHKLKTLQLFS